MGLTQSPFNSVADDYPPLTIDHYTRLITIPKSITNLGVEMDDEVLRLNFKMPRYFGTVDLYEFDIRINYVNAIDEYHTYRVTDKAIHGDDVIFSWLVGPDATVCKGNTRFNVRMVIADDNSVIEHEYNTEAVILPVLQGIETLE